MVNGCGLLLTDVPTMQAGGYVPPALTLVIPGYDSLLLHSVHIKNKAIHIHIHCVSKTRQL